MLRSFVFTLVIVVLLNSCSRTEDTTKTIADSTAQAAGAPDPMLPVFAYDRASTLEGQFAERMKTGSSDTLTHEGLLALSETLVMQNKSNFTIMGGESDALEFVMFREGAPLMKIESCRNITFVNVNFSSQHTYQALISLSKCSDITFERCTFMSDQMQALEQVDNVNIAFNDCTFGELPYSNAEEPTLEEQGDDSYEAEHQDTEITEGESGGELYETQSAEGDSPLNTPNYPGDEWESAIADLSIPRKSENLIHFQANPFYHVRNPDQMNYASYSALEFARDFFSPIDCTMESATWKEGSDVNTLVPDDCHEYSKILSLTKTRRKLWHIHRKLSFAQESGIGSDDRWRDDTWYRNRSYNYFLFDNRSSTFIAQVWQVAIPYLSNNVTITKQEYNDALLFIDEMLLYYSKIKSTPFWEDRFLFLGKMEVNLTDGNFYHQAGFPVHRNVCMLEGYTGGNYITGYDWGNEAWLYGFWLRRHNEGNMEIVKDILLWARAEIDKRS